MVKNFVSLGGNYMGAFESDIALLSALDFYALLKYWKVHYKAALSTQTHIISTYEQSMRDPRVFSNEEWY